MLLQVVVSGTVGKQVVPTTQQVELKTVTVSTSAANATIKIRDGNASGEVVLWAKIPSAAGTLNLQDIKHKFTKGMHVKLIGSNAQAYLTLN